jgi:hypothetical protein
LRALRLCRPLLDGLLVGDLLAAGRRPAAHQRGLGFLDELADILARVAQDGHGRAQLDRIAFLDQELEQHALVLEVEVHVGLVGLDLGDQVSGLDRVAFSFDPLDQNALFHGRRELGQSDDLSHFLPFNRCQAHAAPVRSYSR